MSEMSGFYTEKKRPAEADTNTNDRCQVRGLDILLCISLISQELFKLPSPMRFGQGL